MMMKTIAVCVALVAGPAFAADAPSFVVVGAAGESRTLGVADLQKLTVREVSVTDPHSKQPSRTGGFAAYPCVRWVIGSWGTMYLSQSLLRKEDLWTGG